MRWSLKVQKAALSARSGSSILKNPSDPYYPLVKEFQDVICHDPASVLPPDRGVCHELTWFLEPNTALQARQDSGFIRGTLTTALTLGSDRGDMNNGITVSAFLSARTQSPTITIC